MSALLDTSVIVRYLTGDTPSLAEWSARVIDGEGGLIVTEGVLIETAFVLTKLYDVPRAVVVDSMIEFLGKSNVDVSPLDKPLVIEALLLCRPSARVSFGDALLWARARSEALPVCTLDKRFPGRGIVISRPAVL